MVDMHCDGCVSAVKKRLDALEGKMVITHLGSFQSEVG
jgi:copper chaperone CopZ